MTIELNDVERRVLDEYQRGFPLTPTPYDDIACALGVSESELLAALERLREVGALSRVGAVLRPHAVGASTLAAMAVPPARLDEIATLVSAYPEVNHNYEREHELNLWFVAAAADETRLATVLADIEARSAIAVHRLPMLEDYHIDLGFRLRWT